MSSRHWSRRPRQLLRRMTPCCPPCSRCSRTDDTTTAPPGVTPLLPPGGAGSDDAGLGDGTAGRGNRGDKGNNFWEFDYAEIMASEHFREIQMRYLRERILYEDPDFKADDSSLYRNGYHGGVEWRRPKEITSHPVFFHGMPDYFDFEQGELGNCWFVAAVACLASSPQKALLARVVPKEQTFDTESRRAPYCGAFRFNFWQYGQWKEVVVDDRLPTRRGRLIYGQNKTQPNEFWCPLLEKAYAKLYGNYHTLDGGRVKTALVDMTGGMSEIVRLKGRIGHQHLRTLLLNTRMMNSFIGGAINQLSGHSASREILLQNGLYSGHAYSVIDVKEVSTNGGKTVLLHVRNPWGKGEWRGAWCDGSLEWRSLDDVDRGATTRKQEEGEFWISMEDFSANFDELGFCHLTPDALSAEIADNLEKSNWRVTEHVGAWVRGVSAGGSARSYMSAKFWSNPQYELSLINQTTPTTVVVSLMRKESYPPEDIGIGFSIFKLGPGRKPQSITQDNFYAYNIRLEQTSGQFWPYRERTLRFELEPGAYVIVPSTFREDKESEFYLRVFCENDHTTGPVEQPFSADHFEALHASGEKDVQRQLALDEFDQLADTTRASVSAEGLVKVFSAAFGSSESDLKGFNVETCRCLVSLVNHESPTGEVSREEFESMWKSIQLWRNAFHQIDINNSGSLDATEFEELFIQIVDMCPDFGHSKEAIDGIMRRYGDSDGRVGLEDFIQGFCRTLLLYKTHQEMGNSSLSLGEWITLGFRI